VTWQPGSGEAARLYAVQYKVGNAWRVKVVPGGQTAITVDAGKLPGAITRVAVSAVDRNGNQSKVVAADVAGPGVATPTVAAGR
jgi:hypothetical protein